MENKLTLALLILSICLVLLLGYLLIAARRRSATLSDTISDQKITIENAEKVKDRIFITVGHHMKSSVNMLSSFTQLQQSSDIQPKAMKIYLDELNSIMRDNIFLMENLFKWGNSQVDGFKPRIEKFDIGIRSRVVLEAFASRIADKNIRVENSISGNAVVSADMSMTELVLKNVISNAIKYTPKGGVITISSQQQGEQLRISVTDNGIGLPEGLEEQFNKGNQLYFVKSTHGTDKEGGTGVGLLICKYFMKLMNGTISLESQPTGSTASILLPR